MDVNKLRHTAKLLVANGKGILAADESNPSCKKRFDAVGVECTPETRRQYRQILINTATQQAGLSGIIFYDETFWQTTDDGELFRDVLRRADILPGIKVDEGLIDLPGFPGEKISKGLDSLPDRIAKYAESGAMFAKWRSVLAIDNQLPSDECIEANAFVLARYARICQEVGVVPIVEPEVLIDGNHTIEQSELTLTRTLRGLFKLLNHMRIYLPGVILKTSMVLPGKESGQPIHNHDVADRTVKVLHEQVPSDFGGVVFLSGGQTPDDAYKNLNLVAQKGPHPWGVTFSYSRALQDPVLKSWAKRQGDPNAIFTSQLKRAVAARQGSLDMNQTSEDFVSDSQDL